MKKYFTFIVILFLFFGINFSQTKPAVPAVNVEKKPDIHKIDSVTKVVQGKTIVINNDSTMQELDSLKKAIVVANEPGAEAKRIDLINYWLWIIGVWVLAILGLFTGVVKFAENFKNIPFIGYLLQRLFSKGSKFANTVMIACTSITGILATLTSTEIITGTLADILTNCYIVALGIGAFCLFLTKDAKLLGIAPKEPEKLKETPIPN